MKNVLIIVLEKFPELKKYGLTEAFVINGELHTTSRWEIPREWFMQIEKEVVA